MPFPPGVFPIHRTLATELAKERITVNAYAPGFIETPIISKYTISGVRAVSSRSYSTWWSATPVVGEAGIDTADDVEQRLTYVRQNSWTLDQY